MSQLEEQTQRPYKKLTQEEATKRSIIRAEKTMREMSENRREQDDPKKIEKILKIIQANIFGLRTNPRAHYNRILNPEEYCREVLH